VFFVRSYMKYRTGPRIQFAVCCLLSVLGNFKSSDWSTLFMKVILLGLLLVRISWGHQTSTVAVQTSTFVHKLVQRLDLFINCSKHSVCTTSILCQCVFCMMHRGLSSKCVHTLVQRLELCVQLYNCSKHCVCTKSINKKCA
jgi:hypothetical protein